MAWHQTRPNLPLVALVECQCEILPWGTERVAQEQVLRAAAEQRAETEKQRAEAEKQRADFAEQEIARLKQLLGEKG